MRRRLAPHVISDPGIMGGVPVVEGTRIPVYIILENLEVGHTFDEIVENYPSLTRETFQAAVHWAAELSSAA
jgi:uncharacterized protein (DUF433 family)